MARAATKKTATKKKATRKTTRKVESPAAEAPAETAPTDNSTDTPPEAQTNDGAGDPAGAAQGETSLLVAGTVSVVGPQRGRRRIGRQFGPEPVAIALADLSEDELAALRADDMLKLTFVGDAK